MPTERIPLDLVASQSNLTGATAANLDDDPDSYDANWAVATSDQVSTEIRATFPTASDGLTVGADLQEFRVVVRKTNSNTGTPTARLELWEGGVLIRAGSEENVTSEDGDVFAFTWNANEETDETA